MSTLANKGKYPCVLFPCFIPTTFIEEWLLVVEAVIVFGSGVAGLSVLTHMHTPPLLTSQWKKKPLPSLPQDFTLSTTVQEHSRTLHYTSLLTCCSSSHRSGSGSRSRTSIYGHSRHCIFDVLPPTIFLAFTHAVFLCGFT